MPFREMMIMLHDGSGMSGPQQCMGMEDYDQIGPQQDMYNDESRP